MKTSELFSKKQVLSFEIFPPKNTSSINTIYETVKQLKAIQPDFISVTFGAGGTRSNNETIRIASEIKNQYHIESVAHLPSINFEKSEILEILSELKLAGIENILALRGDLNPNIKPKRDFRYASDLVRFIKENGDFHIIGACYPQGHSESQSLEEDIKNLKVKVDAGADQLITQLFLDNTHFHEFRERAHKHGIHVPIQAGIMPVTKKKQIERMVSLSGVELPKKFQQILERYGDSPESMRDAGIAYAIDQIVDLLASDVDGIHLYTMNNPYIANRIYDATNSLFSDKRR